ncbi:4-hydroxy-tetrahydrodipicolinate synthase [bacterium]|nr:4-hydroxy-tetrahydrodipicolinate synthase [bacterium]MBU1614600.1 4-hydroxy-tetrahydrodipicolinate synthase [bacterium]
MFEGSFVPIVTPFKEGKVDFEGLARLIEFHLQQGSDGLVPCGTTGESATLNHEEHREVVNFCIEKMAGRGKVIAGAGSNSTKEALGLIKFAKESGADAALVITPYYNKPTQDGLYEHYKYLAERVDLPIILYNVPSRTGVNILPRTVARLAEIENIVGIKEASANMAQVSEIIKLCGDRIEVICGEDTNLLSILAVGGVGAISASANVAPRDFANLVREFHDGNLSEARRLHLKLFPLCQAMFIETNPAPAKAALTMMGLISDELRLPLVSVCQESLDKIRSVLMEGGWLDD